MAHRTPRGGYRELAARLNRHPQGAPPTRLLFEILGMLFSEREAGWVSRLPLRPFDAAQAARLWRVSAGEAERRLDALADRGLLVDMPVRGRMHYVLPPPMAGFFEFALMRVRDDLDQKLLAELYEQYISVEEDFIKGLFVDGQTQLGRVFVQEPVLTGENALHVLDYDRATHVVDTASVLAVGLCYCRHKRAHLGRACAAEQANCLTFNVVADSLVRHGIARRIDRAEAHDILGRAWEQNLAQFGENVQQGVNFICNCCPCCCEAMLAAQRFGHLRPVHTSSYLAEIQSSCSGCVRCLPACPVRVITLASEKPDPRGRWRAVIDASLCLGCGVCARVCQRAAVRMTPRAQRVITPVNAVHRTVLMAIERGKLQHLIVDNQVLWSHRALAAMLGAILRLPPVKRLLASEQVGSRYLGQLCERYEARQAD